MVTTHSYDRRMSLDILFGTDSPMEGVVYHQDPEEMEGVVMHKTTLVGQDGKFSRVPEYKKI